MLTMRALVVTLAALQFVLAAGNSAGGEAAPFKTEARVSSTVRHPENSMEEAAACPGQSLLVSLIIRANAHGEYLDRRLVLEEEIIELEREKSPTADTENRLRELRAEMAKLRRQSPGTLVVNTGTTPWWTAVSFTLGRHPEVGNASDVNPVARGIQAIVPARSTKLSKDPMLTVRVRDADQFVSWQWFLRLADNLTPGKYVLTVTVPVRGKKDEVLTVASPAVLILVVPATTKELRVFVCESRLDACLEVDDLDGAMRESDEIEKTDPKAYRRYGAFAAYYMRTKQDNAAAWKWIQLWRQGYDREQHDPDGPVPEHLLGYYNILKKQQENKGPAK